jgi:hypothetical protein
MEQLVKTQQRQTLMQVRLHLVTGVKKESREMTEENEMSSTYPERREWSSRGRAEDSLSTLQL